jgi:hypothetical protein
MGGFPDWINPVMQWVVVPVLGWLGLLHSRQAKQNTDIAVLQTKIETHAHQYDRIMKKLDGIEAALRKD